MSFPGENGSDETLALVELPEIPEEAVPHGPVERLGGTRLFGEVPIEERVHQAGVGIKVCLELVFLETGGHLMA